MTKQSKIDITDVIYSEYDNGLSRDQIIILLVSEHGLTLNAATKAYAKVAKEYGWTATLVSHKADAIEYIDDELDAGAPTVAEVQGLIPAIVSRFEVAESTARDYIRAYCDERGFDYPVLNPREAIFEWFKHEAPNHDPADRKAAFMEYATGELGRSQSNANEYWKGYELHLYLTAK